MPQKAIFKTVYQYNKEPISKADMERLLEIAGDCNRVKNYVYQRYSGINGLSKLYPGYTVQNEMTDCGLREQLGLPSVYFYPAIFDALGDIKSHWSHAKNTVEKNIRRNENLTPEDRHYLRFVMKQSQCFEAILAGREILLPQGWREAYERVCADVDPHRLNRYLCRQIRRHLRPPHTDAADGFAVSPKGYRYDDHGIHISMKEKRQRLFIPLTDNNHYGRQLSIRLYPQENNITISIPLEVRPRKRKDYQNEVGLAVGMRCMFVTDAGAVYGEKYLEYQSALTDYIREKLPRQRKNARNNPGKKKYMAARTRLEAALHTYINGEINRMLEAEKPRILYVPKLPGTSKAGVSKKMNASVSMWQKGYIKSRLVQKCRERSIELVEVFGKGISTECSRCGAEGEKRGEGFCCGECGLQLPERENTARNTLRRGRTNQGQMKQICEEADSE